MKLCYKEPLECMWIDLFHSFEAAVFMGFFVLFIFHAFLYKDLDQASLNNRGCSHLFLLLIQHFIVMPVTDFPFCSFVMCSCLLI